MIVSVVSISGLWTGKFFQLLVGDLVRRQKTGNPRFRSNPAHLRPLYASLGSRNEFNRHFPPPELRIDATNSILFPSPSS